MGNLSVIVKQLKKERDKVEKQLSGLNAALAAFVGTYYGNGAKPTRNRRKISAAGRKKNRGRAACAVGRGEAEKKAA